MPPSCGSGVWHFSKVAILWGGGGVFECVRVLDILHGMCTSCTLIERLSICVCVCVCMFVRD